MNTLSLSVDSYEEDAPLLLQGIRFAGVSIVSALIDGDTLAEINPELDGVLIVFDELQASTQASGRYLIFTCACGVAECGGWDGIDVTIKGAVIHWRGLVGVKWFEYSFSRDQYITEVNSARDALMGSSEPVIYERVIFPLGFRR